MAPAPSCCVVLCAHSSKYCKMKRFPSDPKRAAVWESNIGRPDWKRSESSYICECHFDATQFERNKRVGSKQLRHNAVPLIFPTHVLVVHDPSGTNKWLSPEPRPHPSQLQRHPLRPSKSPKKPYSMLAPSRSRQKWRKISKVAKGTSQSSKADHIYAKGSADEESERDSIMCDRFCQEDELDELQILGLSPSGTNKVVSPIQNGSPGSTDELHLSTGPNVSSRTRSRSSIPPSKSPTSVSELPEGQNKVHSSQASTIAKLQRLTDSQRARKSSQYSLPTPLKTLDAHNEQQSSPVKPDDLMQEPIEILDVHSQGESEIDSEADFCLVKSPTPKVWDSEELNGSTLVPPETLKDALSFLQFMLPQKWLAFSENSGIHVALISRSKAKSIQRCVFVPFNGGKIELYVHAKKLLRDHEIFGNACFTQNEPLTQDSVGSYVDRIVSIIELFSSYETCNGVTDREYLLVWRKFTDCMLDCNSFGEETYDQTVRSVACNLLAPKDGVRCKMCDTLYE